MFQHNEKHKPSQPLYNPVEEEKTQKSNQNSKQIARKLCKNTRNNHYIWYIWLLNVITCEENIYVT